MVAFVVETIFILHLFSIAHSMLTQLHKGSQLDSSFHKPVSSTELLELFLVAAFLSWLDQCDTNLRVRPFSFDHLQNTAATQV